MRWTPFVKVMSTFCLPCSWRAQVKLPSVRVFVHKIVRGEQTILRSHCARIEQKKVSACAVLGLVCVECIKCVPRVHCSTHPLCSAMCVSVWVHPFIHTSIHSQEEKEDGEEEKTRKAIASSSSSYSDKVNICTGARAWDGPAIHRRRRQSQCLKI